MHKMIYYIYFSDKSIIADALYTKIVERISVKKCSLTRTYL